VSGDSAGKILFVCGLGQEARLVGRGAGMALCGNAATLADGLARLDAAAFRAVVSFGLCGGLDPALAAGDLVIASLVSGREVFETDVELSARLRDLLRAAGEPVHAGGMAAVDAPAMSPAAKADLRAGTGAVAVDMESGIAAAFAARHRKPLIVLRAVSDAANRSLPPLAAQVVTPAGEIDNLAVALGVLRAPLQIPTLIATGRDSAAAFRALLRGYRGLAGLFLSLGSADL